MILNHKLTQITKPISSAKSLNNQMNPYSSIIYIFTNKQLNKN